jgi:alpha-galactosidase
MHKYLVLAFAGIVYGAPSNRLLPSKRLDNGSGKTPAMGFNNWNAGIRKTYSALHSDDILNPILASSANTALAAASAFLSLGLKDLGYQFINIDDAWSTMSRSNGLLVPDPNKWPNGVTPVAKQIHDMGLKLGMRLGCSNTKADKQRSLR